MAGKWIKIYFTQEQYAEMQSGNGLAIGYLESEVMNMKQMEKIGIDCGLTYDKLDHMTKVDPDRVSAIPWSEHGVYVD